MSVFFCNSVFIGNRVFSCNKITGCNLLSVNHSPLSVNLQHPHFIHLTFCACASVHCIRTSLISLLPAHHHSLPGLRFRLSRLLPDSFSTSCRALAIAVLYYVQVGLIIPAIPATLAALTALTEFLSSCCLNNNPLPE